MNLFSVKPRLAAFGLLAFWFSFDGSAVELNVYIYQRLDPSEASCTTTMKLLTGGNIGISTVSHTRQSPEYGELTQNGIQSEITLMPLESSALHDEPECIDKKLWKIDVSIGTNIPGISRVRSSQFIQSEAAGDKSGGNGHKPVTEGLMPTIPNLLDSFLKDRKPFNRVVFRSEESAGRFWHFIDDYDSDKKPTGVQLRIDTPARHERIISLQEVFLHLLEKGKFGFFSGFGSNHFLQDDLFHITYGHEIEICIYNKARRSLKVIIRNHSTGVVYVMLITVAPEVSAQLPAGADETPAGELAPQLPPSNGTETPHLQGLNAEVSFSTTFSPP